MLHNASFPVGGFCVATVEMLHNTGCGSLITQSLGDSDRQSGQPNLVTMCPELIKPAPSDQMGPLATIAIVSG